MRRAFLVVMVLIGCTSSEEDAGPHIDLVSTPYTLQPGEERYYCYTMDLPAEDIAITKLTPTYGEGTHHILFSQSIAPEPEGFSDCNVLIRTTWIPLYAGGLDSGPLTLPEKTGFVPFEKGQQVIMQLHLQNSTDAPITDTTKMRIDYVARTPEIKSASIFGMDNRKLNIPPNTPEMKSEMSCTVSRDLEVFAVMGHMHKFGVHIDLSRGATAGEEMLYQTSWDFETQPVTPMKFRVNLGDKLHLRCTHKNDTATAVPYGESSDTEMCSFVMYHAPSTALDGCISE
ncbi:MAG TPA: hypothetical protein VIV11_41650 [Kofleriaceae bacterium]